MPRNKRKPRTSPQVDSDKAADALAKTLGRMLRDRRAQSRRTQADVAAKAGMPRSTYATLEGRAKGGVSLRTWSRAATALGTELHAYLGAGSAADAPQDWVHLRAQELVLATAARGEWAGVPEAQLDRVAETSRSADCLLTRGREWALMEVVDWFSDVGGGLRDWDRRRPAAEALAITRMPLGDEETDPVLPVVSGCWIVRATKRNRRLVAEHGHVFRTRFPGSAVDWLRALTDPEAPMPREPALLWARVDGSELFASRLG